jgi:hypothetical protein
MKSITAFKLMFVVMNVLAVIFFSSCSSSQADDVNYDLAPRQIAEYNSALPMIYSIGEGTALAMEGIARPSDDYYSDGTMFYFFVDETMYAPVIVTKWSQKYKRTYTETIYYKQVIW